MRRSSIPRIQAFEFHDLAGFPSVFRSALTEWLRAAWAYSRAADVIAPILARALHQSGAERVIDLCSGGTGPIIPIQKNLESLGVCVPVLATDKYPDPAVMAGLKEETGGRVTGDLQSLDATSLPENFGGFRTLFNSFHHFSPAQARQILAGAYRSRQPIGVFEMTERTVPKVLLCFPASFLSVFFLKMRTPSHHLSRWFFTWILPLIPLTIAWDGLVSHLRSYTDTEMQELIAGLDGRDYTWELGRVSAPQGGIDINFLIGRPLPGDVQRP